MAKDSCFARASWSSSDLLLVTVASFADFDNAIATWQYSEAMIASFGSILTCYRHFCGMPHLQVMLCAGNFMCGRGKILRRQRRLLVASPVAPWPDHCGCAAEPVKATDNKKLNNLAAMLLKPYKVACSALLHDFDCEQ